ncbi:hypothetical protein B0H10DRAFT_2240543 [Mycena sp. CBHHK59/15]|nr:hypothetical protein B0H10DRAFT_2240543 [Mycena sp. CBHHK59/15]
MREAMGLFRARKQDHDVESIRPFLAPAIVDLIHETWWSSSKALGFKYAKKLKSHRADHPEEVVLPDAMICLATVNLWASLLAYSTGRYVPPPEFNQAPLEGMYKTLLDIMQEQRNGKSGKAFNGIMHDLYRKVSQSSVPVATAASGSGNSVICLEIDSD